MEGLICILQNPHFPNYLTIRKSYFLTSREVIQEFHNESTSVSASEINLIYEKFVSDCDLIERTVQSKLRSKREKSKKDKFLLPAKNAIDCIEGEIVSLIAKRQLVYIESRVKIVNDRDWWNDLSFSWKNVLKSAIHIKFSPSEDEIHRAIHNAIDNSGSTNLRKKIAQLITSKNYIKGLENWYFNLGSDKQNFDWYLPYEMSDAELVNIINIKELDCRTSQSIIDLQPIQRLTRLKSLNCSYTNISDVSSIANHYSLTELNVSYTNVDEILTLSSIKTLNKLICIDIELSKNKNQLFKQIAEVRESLPNCIVESESFLSQPTETSSVKRRRSF